MILISSEPVSFIESILFCRPTMPNLPGLLPSKTPIGPNPALRFFMGNNRSLRPLLPLYHRPRSLSLPLSRPLLLPPDVLSSLDRSHHRELRPFQPPQGLQLPSHLRLLRLSPSLSQQLRSLLLHHRRFRSRLRLQPCFVMSSRLLLLLLPRHLPSRQLKSRRLPPQRLSLCQPVRLLLLHHRRFRSRLRLQPCFVMSSRLLLFLLPRHLPSRRPKSRRLQPLSAERVNFLPLRHLPRSVHLRSHPSLLLVLPSLLLPSLLRNFLAGPGLLTYHLRCYAPHLNFSPQMHSVLACDLCDRATAGTRGLAALS